MSAIAIEFHTLVTKLEEEGHALADRFRALFEKVTGDAPALIAEAKADVSQVEADAIKAAAPVVAEVEHDAVQLAGEAVADIKDVISPTPVAAPPVTDPAPAAPVTPSA